MSHLLPHTHYLWQIASLSTPLAALKMPLPTPPRPSPPSSSLPRVRLAGSRAHLAVDAGLVLLAVPIELERGLAAAHEDPLGVLVLEVGEGEEEDDGGYGK